MVPERKKSKERGIILGYFVSFNATGITTIFMTTSIVKSKSLDIHNGNNNFIVIRSHHYDNVGSKVACGFIRQRKYWKMHIIKDFL